MNAMLSDRLALARRKQFGSSSEKYAEGYEQMDLFNEAEASADPEAEEPCFEEIHPSSYKRKSVQERRKKISPALKSPRPLSTSWPEKTVTVRTAGKSTRLLPKRP